MNGPRFRVGDWVRVKTLDEIKGICKSIETYPNGYTFYCMPYGVSFIEGNVSLCGNVYEVVEEDDTDVGVRIPGMSKLMYLSVYAVDKGKTNFDWMHTQSPERLAHFLDTTSRFSCTNKEAILRWLNKIHTAEDEK